MSRKKATVSSGSCSMASPHPTMSKSGGGSTACAATRVSGVTSEGVFTPQSNDSSS